MRDCRGRLQGDSEITAICGGRENPMLNRIFAAAVVIFALMVVIKDGRVLRSTGFTASCSVVQTAADGEQLDACRPGKLEGRPSLASRSCTSAGVRGTLEYWRCPAQLTASSVGR